jgi:hypothetical protein
MSLMVEGVVDRKISITPPEKRLVATVCDRWFADSPLEESGFEPLVPLLNRHNRRTGRMSPTASIRVAY